MKQRNKIIASILLCLLVVVVCVTGLIACECSHTYGDWTVKTAATCTANGVKERVCTKCEHVESGVINATGHSYTVETANADTQKTAATCTNPGVYYKSCQCGAISDVSTFTYGSTISHNYTEQVVSADTLKSVATCTSPAIYYKSCTCGDVSDTLTFTSGNKLPHVFELENVVAEALKTEATCQNLAVYYKSCVCGEVSQSNTEIFTSGSIASHSYTQEVVKPTALKSEATCESPAIYYKSCTCGLVSTNNTDTFTYGVKNDHVYDQEIANPNTWVSDATCTSPAIYKKSCECGDISDNLTFTSGSVIPHSPQQVASTEATCTEAATVTYACSCGTYEYTDTVGSELGHDIEGVTPTERLVDGCEYVYIYICQRQGCGAEVEGATIYKHKHVARITTVATCQHEGEKTLTCVCGDTQYEEIPVDATGHVWVKGTVSEGVRTDECDICHTTKSVTVYDSNVTAATNANDFKDTEIELKVDTDTNANIKLDDGVIDSIGNKEVTVSAGKLSSTEISDLGIDTDKLAQVGNNPIYDFTIKDTSNGNAISQFGEENFVTITLPYALGGNEDVNSIAVWFISDKCEDEDCDVVDCTDSAHRLVSIKATYNNGFITFKTNHFSKYTVTRLTAEERCKLYGHSYEEHKFEGNCLQNSYSVYVCVRCHDKREEITRYAPGHNHQLTDSAVATCVTGGYEKYECMNEGCNHQYTITVDAIGHDWDIVQSTPASCTTNGYTEYSCLNEGCDGTYAVVTDKLPHSCDENVVAPTCEADGYTEYDCINCDYSYVGDYVVPLGHSYEVNSWGWAPDYSMASVSLVCRNDADHVVNLNANIVKTVINGTCSSFVKTIYTAKVSYGGTIYEDEQITEEGTPDHRFGTTLKHDEDEHWYECDCGEKNEVEKHVFENEEETKAPTCVAEGEKTSYCVCGATHVDKVPATGKHNYVNNVCTGCGEGATDHYFVNLVNSWKDINGFTIKIHDFSFELKSKHYQSGDWMLYQSIEQVDVAELTLYFEDGEICGGARGSVEMYEYYSDGDTKTYDMEAVIANGAIYVSLKDENGNTIQNIVQSLDEVYGYIDMFMDSPLSGFVTDTVLPTVDSIVEANKDGLNDILNDFFNILFTFECENDGDYVVTLDFDKLNALNENLADKTVSELMDTYFGEGAFDKLVAFVKDVLNLKFSEIPEFVEEIGVDYDTLITNVNSFINAMTPNATTQTDIGAFIESEDMADITVGMMIFNTQDDSYLGMIDQYLPMFSQNSVYDLISGDLALKTKADVKDVLDMLAGKVNVSFETDCMGMLTAVKLGIDELSVVEGSSSTYINGELDILVNEKIDITWTDIVDEIDNMIAMPPVEMQDEIYTNMDICSGTVWYDGEEYEYDSGISMYFSKPIYDELYCAEVSPDCGTWVHNYLRFKSMRYSFLQANITVDDSSKMLFIDEYSGEMVEAVDKGTYFTFIYEDGTEKNVDKFEIDKQSDWLDLFTEIFEDSGRINYYDASHYYYYNKILNQYAGESQHEYEATYVMEGDDCEDGVTVTYTCKHCNDSYVEEYSYHYEYIEEELNLADYGSVCGGTITLSKCACGKSASIDVNDLYNNPDSCDFSENSTESWIENAIEGYQVDTEGDYSEFYNSAYIMTCAVTDPQCAFKIRYANYWLKVEDKCLAERYQTWQFGYDESTGECEYEITFKTGAVSVYHDFEYTYGDNYNHHDCADCDSYYHETNTYDGNGNTIKREKKGYDTTGYANYSYYEEVDEYSLYNDELYISREYVKYAYDDGGEYWYERKTTKSDYTASFGEDGYKTVTEYTNSDGEENTSESAYTYYKGYGYCIYECGTQGIDDYWYRWDYTYDFTDTCMKTERYTNSYGQDSTYTYGACKDAHGTTVKAPTCTQDGLRTYSCDVCEHVTETYIIEAHDHDWVEIDGWYYCLTCGLENPNGSSGTVIMEDLTDTYGNGENYVVGYMMRNGDVEFTKYVTLLVGDDEIIVEGIDIVPVDGLRAFAFSKTDVEAYAEMNGYTDYLVKFVFVPYNDEWGLDYAVTFTERNYDSTITGDVTFVDYIPEGEYKEYTIAPAEDGVWVFTSYGYVDPWATLYDEDGNELAYSDDYNGWNFYIAYELEAGKTYTVKVGIIGDSSNVALSFFQA